MYILKCGISLDGRPNVVQAFEDEGNLFKRIENAIDSKVYKKIEIDVVPDECASEHYWQTK